MDYLIFLKIFSFLWQLCQISSVLGFKPVIVMHGILPSPTEISDFQGFIERAHPGTNVTLITAYDKKLLSLAPMWKQTKAASDVIQNISQLHPEGFHLLCFSQGGLVCRAVLQTLPTHNCDTFISLTSPQAGQYGDSSIFKHYLPPLVKEDLYEFFYTKVGQDISVGNYWNDPHHQDLYHKESVFLAVLNDPRNQQRYRKNFLRTKKLVMFGSPDDGVITPWQSSHFSYLDSNENIVPMQQQRYYINDTFGLRTMNEANRLHIFTVPGMNHTKWHKNEAVFNKYVTPWLT